MITDKERREVARKLREPKESLLAYPADELIRLRHETGCHRGQDFYEHLADLIEPVPERTCRMIDNGAELCCSECDWRHDYDDEPKFCAGCGAKVVGFEKPRYCPNCGAVITDD